MICIRRSVERRPPLTVYLVYIGTCFKRGSDCAKIANSRGLVQFTGDCWQRGRNKDGHRRKRFSNSDPVASVRETNSWEKHPVRLCPQMGRFKILLKTASSVARNIKRYHEIMLGGTSRLGTLLPPEFAK
jgi:hypothetical protein